MKLLLATLQRFSILLLIFFTPSNSISARQLPDTWQTGMALTTWHGAGIRNQNDLLALQKKTF